MILWPIGRPKIIKLQLKNTCLGLIYLAHNILNIEQDLALKEIRLQCSLRLGIIGRLDEILMQPCLAMQLNTWIYLNHFHSIHHGHYE